MWLPYPTGLEPKDDLPPRQDDQRLGIFGPGAYRMTMLRMLADGLMTILFLVIARQSGAWQVYGLAALALGLVVVDIFGAVLIRRNRTEAGARLVISSLWVALAAAVALTSGVGILFGLSVVIITTLTAVQSLPSRDASRFILVSLLVGVLVAALDELLPVTWRAPLPRGLSRLLPLIIGLLLLVYIYLITRQFAQYTLRTKLVIAFLLVTLVPLVILASVNDRASRSALTDAANQALFAAASKTATSIDNFITANLNSVQGEAQIPLLREFLLLEPAEQLRTPLRSDTQELLQSFQARDPERLLSYTLLDKEAHVVADTGDLPVGEIAPFMEVDIALQNNYRLVLLTDLPSVSSLKFSPETGTPILYFTARVDDEQGKPIGGLIARYDARVLQDLVVQNNDLAGSNSFGVLFDDFYIHLAHGIAPETIFRAVDRLDPETLEDLKVSMRLPDLPAETLTTNLPGLAANLENAREQPFFKSEDVATGGLVNQVAVAELETQPWKVAFFQPEETFLAPAARQTRVTLLLALLVASLAVVAALGAAQLIASPIVRLTETAIEIAEGNLTARASVETGDEIGALAGAFNRMAGQLQETLQGLEMQVNERTADLRRRALQLQTAAQVAQEAAAIRDIDQLLDQTVRRISDSFGFYHSGIFLVDEAGEYAILQAASSEGGQRMLARGHKLQIGRLGIVGYVADTGKPRIALDVGADAVYFDNPDLPKTRSEMALPLKVKNQVIGVLDVQSTEPAAFTDEDVEVLQILADQIALAIENTRLLEESQRALQELENLYRQQVAQAWQQRSRNQPIAFRYNRVGVEALDAALAAQMSGPNDRQNGKQVVLEGRILRAPIRLRGQKLGAIVLRRDEDQPPWRQEERALVEEIVTQLSLALENTRLYEETRQRAERERLIGEVTSHIRQTLDFETVLQTAVRQMQETLNLEWAEVRMGEPDEDVTRTPNPQPGEQG